MLQKTVLEFQMALRTHGHEWYARISAGRKPVQEEPLIQTHTQIQARSMDLYETLCLFR